MNINYIVNTYIMEKDITLRLESSHIGTTTSWHKVCRHLSAIGRHLVLLTPLVGQLLSTPLQWLRHYYSRVLEKEVNLKQTRLLLECQLAFMMGAFPAESPLGIRLLCIVWLLNALYRCKRSGL